MAHIQRVIRAYCLEEDIASLPGILRGGNGGGAILTR